MDKIKVAGIPIEVLDMGQEALNPFFDHYIRTGQPWITLKVAQSLDGKITSASKYITNELSRKKVHEMRAEYSTILTTTQTILADNPLLDCRLETFDRRFSSPDVVIVGKSKIPEEAKVFSVPNRKVLQFDILDDFLNSQEITKIDSIMTECGQTLNTELMKRGLVNQIDLFTAPVFLGNSEKEGFASEVDLDNFKITDTGKLGDDMWVQFQQK